VAELVKVEGLAEFNRNLKKLDRSLPKALRLALNKASDVVVEEALPSIPTRTGRARASLKPRSTRSEVRVAGGGSRAPYYPWLDFGGRVGRARSVVRPFIKEGRYLYAAYFRKRDSGEFQAILSKALREVAESAGLGVE
jgi:hypothetical protein